MSTLKVNTILTKSGTDLTLGVLATTITIPGNLTVNGALTTVSTTNTIIKDSLIELNNGASSNSNDCGIVIERGSTGDNAAFIWDESADTWLVGTTTATGASTGNLTLTDASLKMGNLTATGDVLLGNATGDDVTITGRIAADIDPKTDNTYDLGASGLEWKDLYVDGVAYIDTLGADGDPTTAYIGGGEVDSTVIGGETPAAATFTTCSATGAISGSATLNIGGILSGSGNLKIAGDTFLHGKLGVGQDAPYFKLEVMSNEDGEARAAVMQFDDDTATDAANLLLLRSRGTFTSPNVVQDGDALGSIDFYGHDGSGWEQAATIRCQVDGTPNNDSTDMPGRLLFMTTPDGSDSVSERMRINNAGKVGIGDDSPGTLVQIKGTDPYLTLQNSTSENTDGGCESKIIFEDHANASLAVIQSSHDGTADDTKGDLIISTHNGSSLTEAVRIDSGQLATFAGGGIFDAGTSNAQTMSTVTLPSNYNSVLYGPITIGSGETVRIGTSSNVKILDIANV